MIFIKEIECLEENSSFTTAIIEFVKGYGKEIEMLNDFDVPFKNIPNCKLKSYLAEDIATTLKECDEDKKIDLSYDICEDLTLNAAICLYLKHENINSISFILIHEISNINNEIEEITLRKVS